MQIKTIAMVALVGCAIGLSTGCVKQEEYDNMVKQKDADKAQAVAELQNTISEKDSLLTAEQTKSRGLQNQLREASVELTEYKDAKTDLESKIEDANSKIDRLESSLAATKRQVESAMAKIEESDAACSKAEMEAQEYKRRFDMLRKALLDLQGIKPADLGIEDLLNGSDDMGGMDTGSSDAADSGSKSDSLEGILDDMGNM